MLALTVLVQGSEVGGDPTTHRRRPDEHECRSTSTALDPNAPPLDPIVKRVLTADEVSEILGVPVKTLAHWRTHRLGPLFFRAGVHVRYTQDDVEAWIKERLDETREWMAG